MVPRRAVKALVLALPLIGNLSAAAEVMDVSSDGTVTVYDQPAVYSVSGVHPIFRVLPAAPSVATGGVDSMIASAAQRYAISPTMLRAVAWTESHYQISAVSPKGAVGIMQLMPATAKALGVDRYDMAQNILGGAAYLRAMMDRYGQNSSLALAAYNAGPLVVDRFGGVPPYAETQNYVRTILGGYSSAIHSPLSAVILFNH